MSGNKVLAADVLLEFERGVEAWTMAQCEIRMRVIAGRMREVVEEQRDNIMELAEATAEYEKVFHTKHLESALDPDREGWRTAMHESFAKNESELLNRRRILAKEMKTVNNAEIRVLEEIMGALRSHNTNARALGGGHQ